MINPLDNSDLASLIQADWHEEFGNIDYANEIRESVLEPQINTWHWIDELIGVGKGDGIGGRGRVGGFGNVNIGVGNDIGVGGGDVGIDSIVGIGIGSID